MESRIRIKATMPEMYTFFKEETGVRFMEIHDMRYSSDEIDHSRTQQNRIRMACNSSASRRKNGTPRYIYDSRHKEEAGKVESGVQSFLILHPMNGCGELLALFFFIFLGTN